MFSCNLSNTVVQLHMLTNPETRHSQQMSSSIATTGGNVALDLLNTIMRTPSGIVDQLGDEREATKWLQTYGLVHGKTLVDSETVEALVKLRSIARRMIEARLVGRTSSPAELNAVLRNCASHWVMSWDRHQGATPTRRLVLAGATELSALAPVAEEVARLLIREDFGVVKRCGNPDCTMLFLDQTATRRRRWCSMATCGNRMKVAAFRDRLRD
jgi:predicted RNA-binding Zn ribbon-like protein